MEVKVLRIWCLTAGPQLEGNWMVELIQVLWPLLRMKSEGL